MRTSPKATSANATTRQPQEYPELRMLLAALVATLVSAGRALHSSVGCGDVEVVSALEVGFERETHALGDVALYRG